MNKFSFIALLTVLWAGWTAGCKKESTGDLGGTIKIGEFASLKIGRAHV